MHGEEREVSHIGCRTFCPVLKASETKGGLKNLFLITLILSVLGFGFVLFCFFLNMSDSSISVAQISRITVAVQLTIVVVANL